MRNIKTSTVKFWCHVETEKGPLQTVHTGLNHEKINLNQCSCVSFRHHKRKRCCHTVTRVVYLQVCWGASVSPVLPGTTAPSCWRRRAGCCTWEAAGSCTRSTPPTSPRPQTWRWATPIAATMQSAVSSHSLPFPRGGLTNISLKQIEQIPLCPFQFYGYGIKSSRRLFKGHWAEPETLWAALSSHFPHTLVFFFSSAPSLSRDIIYCVFPSLLTALTRH